MAFGALGAMQGGPGGVPPHEGALKLWDHIGDVLDKVHQAMVERLQVFKTTVRHWKSGDPVKLKVLPFKVSYYTSVVVMAHLTFGSNG